MYNCIFGISKGGGKVMSLLSHHLGDGLGITWLNSKCLVLWPMKAFLLSENPDVNLAEHH